MLENSKNLKTLLIEQVALEEKLVNLMGELTPELEKDLMTLEVSIPQKVSNYQGLIDRLKLESDNLYAKSEKYKLAAEQLFGLKDRLLANIKHLMVTNGLEEIRGNDESFALTKGKQSVQITDLSKLPRVYICQQITERPDKEKIYNAIKSGEIVPGSELQETSVLRRKINKGVT